MNKKHKFSPENVLVFASALTNTHIHAHFTHTYTPSEPPSDSRPGRQASSKPVISEVLGVDWTRLMGDICPGRLSVRVKDYRMRCRHCDKTAHTCTCTRIRPSCRERRNPAPRQTAQSILSSDTLVIGDERPCHAKDCSSVR